MIDNERTNENKIITETIQEGRCNDFDLTKISSEAYLNSVIRKYADQFHHIKRKIRKNIYSEVTKDSDLIDELSFICYLVYNKFSMYETLVTCRNKRSRDKKLLTSSVLV